MASTFTRDDAMKFLAFLTTFIIAFGYPSSSLALNEWQYWNNLNQTNQKSILSENPDTNYVLEESFLEDSFRGVDDLTNQTPYNYEPEVLFEINKNIDFDLNYLNGSKEDQKELINEHGSEIISIAIWNGMNFKINVKTRLGYKNIDGDTKWTWREKLRIEKSIRLGPFEFIHFVSEELIYDFKDDAINQSRLTTGVTKKIVKNFQVDFFYMRKNDKRDSNFPEVTVLGTEFNVRF